MSAGRYVRNPNYHPSDDSSSDDDSESVSSEENETLTEKTAKKKSKEGYEMSSLRINPLMLVDQFPEDPTMEIAREFWVDWIAMLKRLFKLNPKAFNSDEIQITILVTRGGAFLRNILANSEHEFPETFDEAVDRIEQFLRANSNALADEANFGTLKQEGGETFQKFTDRVQKKARVFRLEENRVIAQITQGAKQSDKLMDFGIRGKTSLVELIGYGNQLEVLMRDKKAEAGKENLLASEINAFVMEMNPGLCYAQCQLCDVTVTMLIDSGATLNIIPEDVWLEIKSLSVADGEKGCARNISYNSNRRIEAFGGSLIDVLVTFWTWIKVLHSDKPQVFAQFFVVRAVKKNYIEENTQMEVCEDNNMNKNTSEQEEALAGRNLRDRAKLKAPGKLAYMTKLQD
ncbi:CLUMA_CG014666, isoform A [Clunio marinus]|uniref:CLUMA_CG014666, isoform A n=1 Tax=Clunio marinus TaxID=568069 RepID=A0A1J1IP30_9DIPT|nr:CLUMA_CG014666, isoform A [Clunio marinus]